MKIYLLCLDMGIQKKKERIENNGREFTIHTVLHYRREIELTIVTFTKPNHHHDYYMYVPCLPAAQFPFVIVRESFTKIN